MKDRNTEALEYYIEKTRTDKCAWDGCGKQIYDGCFCLKHYFAFPFVLWFDLWKLTFNLIFRGKA